MIVKIAQEIVEEERAKALKNEPYLSEDEILEKIDERYREFDDLSLKPLINATGVVVHTNLGRSVINRELLNRASKFICSYSNLEYNLKEGKRGSRYDYTSKLLSMMFDCEDAVVINNNASAVFLVLNTFAKGYSTIVSRGELVEIGGSFRVPDVMSNSGTTLKEIGTTNKTKISDYQNAIDESTKMLMKVHKSNFQIAGFSQEVGICEISKLAKDMNLLSYYDLGSGYTGELGYNLEKEEPSVDEVLKSGVDIVSFSGDKLFGSVQSGIILGKKELISKIKKNQLMRMLRVDKITLGLLNETIKAYLNKEFHLITTRDQIHKSIDELSSTANFVASKINANVKVVKTTTFVGGGTMPCVNYPSIALAFAGQDPVILEQKFRENLIIGRIERGEFLLDFRSILKDELENLIKIINRVIN